MEDKNNKRKEKIDDEEMAKLIKSTQEYWFFLGFLKGFHTHNKKLKKAIENIEKDMEKNAPEVWVDYQDVWNYTEKTFFKVFPNIPYEDFA